MEKKISKTLEIMGALAVGYVFLVQFIAPVNINLYNQLLGEIPIIIKLVLVFLMAFSAIRFLRRRGFFDSL